MNRFDELSQARARRSEIGEEELTSPYSDEYFFNILYNPNQFYVHDTKKKLLYRNLRKTENLVNGA